jgi:hypothetical protein
MTALLGTYGTDDAQTSLGNIVLVEGHIDEQDGRPIPWFWKMPLADFGTTRFKKFYYLNVAVEGVDAEGEPNQVQIKVDGNPLGLVDKDKATVKVERTTRTAQFELSGSGTTATSITAIEVDAEPVAYR